ncbi:hypothetical protein [Nocardia arthritidis]|uniref:Uncharacterized protein n=1 Tax=Nocardia arthritidis TaxID=228602 RepID=A0A6G9YKA6_9NOCA|nr:hypothetical protein [Nocardia arthritidis]QIS13642.1 hypothetical protein F5544_28985 [Nocardia arthritidis]
MTTTAGQQGSNPVACGSCGRTRKPLRRGLCGACYGRTRHRRTAYGTWDPDRTAADPVREHIVRLEQAGLSHRRLAALAGLHRSVLNTVLHGRTGRPAPQRISHATAAKILAVPVPEAITAVAAANDTVPVIGAQRRLRALVAIGYPQAHLARELGLQPGNMGPLMHGDRSITVRRHRQIAEVFERLQMTPGPSQAARDYAHRRQWALPLQWDEDSIDDPNAHRHRRRPNANRTTPPARWGVGKPAPTTATEPSYDLDRLAVPVRRRAIVRGR